MTTTHKRAIVSFANRTGNYVKALARLSDSLRDNFQGDFFAWIGEEALGSPKHSDNPYAFKIHAIDKAIEQGYTQILWLDSSCYAIKNLEPLFDVIKRDGLLMQDSDCMLGDWTNDETLSYFGIERETAKQIPMFSAGFFGLNTKDIKATQLYLSWKVSMLKGYFKGSWDNHRHDMSCASAIAYNMGITKLYKPHNSLMQYAGIYDHPLHENIIIKAQGL